MNKLVEKLKKNTKSAYADTLDKSVFFNDRELVPTRIPMLNVALSGQVDGGIGSGILTIAGPSRHFKTSFALEIASSYMEAKPGSVLFFLDSEFGSPQTYFRNFGIDLSRVVHIPITDIEELKFELVNQLERLDAKDEIIIVIDSIGNVASKKEVQDALDEKSVADMTRAKALKGLFRMITPKLRLKNIPLIAVNHTYKEMSLYPRDIPSGGTGIFYSSDAIWIVGRRTNKDKDKQVEGFDFIIKEEKSRFVREGRVIPISVTWDGGIEKNSGLLDIALLGGFVISPKRGAYVGSDPETGEILHEKVANKKETLEDSFWEPIWTETKFHGFIKEYYSIEGVHGDITDLQDHSEQ